MSISLPKKLNYTFSTPDRAGEHTKDVIPWSVEGSNDEVLSESLSP
jgi:hypothetical protein